jgi:four helix bundle protein
MEHVDHLQLRTRQFALDIVRLSDGLPRSRTGEVFGRQLLRSATSVAANYRAACRAKSPADFISKMGTVEEEADESQFWLEMLRDTDLLQPERLLPLIKESDELIAMVVASIRTAKQRLRKT